MDGTGHLDIQIEKFRIRFHRCIVLHTQIFSFSSNISVGEMAMTAMIVRANVLHFFAIVIAPSYFFLLLEIETEIPPPIKKQKNK